VGIEGQYAFALGEGFVLAAGANIGLGELAFGDPGYGLPGSITLKRTTALFVKPGYAVSDSTLVFAKLASLQGTAAWRSSDDRLSGRGVGLGVQMRSGKNVFYQVEWNQNRYDDVVLQNGVERLGSNLWTLGVGYKF
jgi:outer membrane immunogenic protein